MKAERGFHYVRWFNDLGIEDVPLVGGKNAALGELYRSLVPMGVNVPGGFAVTVAAYRDLIRRGGLEARLHALLDGLDGRDVEALRRRSLEARRLILETSMPEEVAAEILRAYRVLQAREGASLSLAVRSSATAEDLPGASFAGQQESFLNVRGPHALLKACHRCMASLFTERAISYRIDQGFDHFKVALSVGVMKMVRADRGSSGVMFTLDTESGFRDVVYLTAGWGLGENIVQGNIEPDEFYVHKPTFRQGHRAVLRRKLGGKAMMMVFARGGGTRNQATPRKLRSRFCLTDAEVFQLAEWGMKIEEHFSCKAGKATPMDIEWAKDGLNGKLYILQARPETVASQKPVGLVEEYRLEGEGQVLVTGHAVGTRVAAGRVRRILDPAQMDRMQEGEVLVTETTTPDWEPVMKKAAAIVTDKGGRTCHAAIVARELGIPAVVGAQDATSKLGEGETVTVSCAEGSLGKVYRGRIPFSVRKIDVRALPKPKTKIMINLGNPDQAFALAHLPVDGVGLARMEFIINEFIRVHPMALLKPERIASRTERRAIARLVGDEAPTEYFIRRLSEGIGTIAAAFYPRPVVVRMSDFKTNEYAALLGGRSFEPAEANPMLGFRGAARYTHPAYAEGFALECQAIRRVRSEMGLANVIVMIPFCRRVAEAERVLQAMAEHGLERGKAGLKVYVMCEIPNNVEQIDAFSRLFDGFSIGSNDLTQLVLGVDRDSELVAFDYDERDPGVLSMIRRAVEGAKRNKRHSGICGQAPSDYPEIAEFLVKIGIDSMSLNPDSVLAVMRQVRALEEALPR